VIQHSSQITGIPESGWPRRGRYRFMNSLSVGAPHKHAVPALHFHWMSFVENLMYLKASTSSWKVRPRSSMGSIEKIKSSPGKWKPI